MAKARACTFQRRKRNRGVGDSLRALPANLPAAHPQAAAPETPAGWKKFEGNPVMGGKYGTCFDISVLHDGDKYRMWLSWRPKASVALVESKDGIHWSEPPQIVLGPRQETGWEDDINRPVVVKRDDGYHMWYTRPGQRTFVDRLRDQSRRRTLEAHERQAGACRRSSPGRKVAVMCPHVIWDDEAKMFSMWYSGGEQYEPECHRLCHQPRRPELDEARGQPGLHSRPQDAPGKSTRSPPARWRSAAIGT